MKYVNWIFVVILISSLTSFVGKSQAGEGLQTGDTAPDIRIKSVNEQADALSSLRGKFVLLSFWSSYDAPSRMRNAALNHVYQQYAASGNLEMVSISFDDYRSVFKGSVRQDRLTAPFCFVETAGARSDIYQTYRLNKGMSNYLLNADGVIVAKDLTADELAAYLN
jgi:peroxiredoxin